MTVGCHVTDRLQAFLVALPKTVAKLASLMVRQPRFPWTQRVRLRTGASRWRATRRIRGRQVYGTLRATPREAYDDAVKMEAQDVAESRPTTLTFGAAIAQVEQELETKRSAGTLAWFRGRLATLRRTWADDTPLARISSAGIEEHIRMRLRDRAGPPPKDGEPDERPTITASTVNHDLRALSRILRLALKRGQLEKNPLAAVDQPRPVVRQMDFLTPAEVAERIATVRRGTDEAHERHADLFELVYLTALRRSEVARLTPADLNFTTRVIFVRGKTRTRELPMSGAAEGILRRLVRGLGEDAAPTTQFFPSVQWIQTTFRRWRKRLKDPRWHAHALRHSAATAMIDAGHDVHTIATVLGHRGLQMLQRYLHARGPALRHAVASLAGETPAEAPSAGRRAKASSPRATSRKRRARRGTPSA